MSDVAGALFLVLIALIFPPLAVGIIAGCGADLLVNIGLTLLGYIPGHVHAFYIMFVYYDRRSRAFDFRPAPGVYSSRVQRGGRHYGAIV